MDYSLLMSVHNLDQAARENVRRQHATLNTRYVLKLLIGRQQVQLTITENSHLMAFIPERTG